MEVDSTEDAQLPPPKIYLSSSLPGSSVPIRAPLTIDSDSEYYLSNNDQIYSRTSSFNSSSSIGISSYGYEHNSVHDEEDDIFLAYPDEEITCRVKENSSTTPFVKYPDGIYVKEHSNFDESAIFRPAVKTPCEESSSVADFDMKLGVPIVPLTSDCDSDVDSGEVYRWLDSGEIPADEIVQNVTISPKVRMFSSEDGDDEGDKESRFEGMFSESSINSIHELNVSMKDSVLAGSIEEEKEKVDCLELVDSQRIDALDLGELPAEGIVENVTNSPKIRIFSSDNEDDEEDKESQFKGVFSDSNVKSIHELNVTMKDSVLAESIEEVQEKVDCLNLVDSQRIDAEVLSNSQNDIEIETISDHKNESDNALIEKEEETVVEIQPIKPKLLNLIRLLGLSNQDSTVVEIFNRFTLGNNEFDSSLTILVIGKTGVGKTATINSIFGENKALTDPFGPGTTTMQELVGDVEGIHLKIIDTPGLKCSPSERSYNLKLLSNIKRLIQEHTPDVVLYVDRLDMYTRDHNDLHLLRLITTSLGSSVWRNCIIALTHSGSNNHEPLGEFVLPKCRFIQQKIVRFGGSDWGNANPVWLVENHMGYRQETNWRNQLIANDDECDQVMPFEPLSELFLEVKKAYFKGDDYRVKLLGTKHWFLACRLYPS